jgi:chromosome segregation ATPase
MTTSVVEPGQQLEQEIEQFERDIEATRAEILEWETRQRECDSLLNELRAQYIEAAGLKVQGKPAPVDKLASQIETLKEQSIGFSHVIGLKREQLSDLQSRLQPLQVQITELVRSRLVEEERVAVASLIAQTERALADLNALALTFGNGVHQLRATKYIDESNRRAAFDAAQSLERRGAGMRA